MIVKHNTSIWSAEVGRRLEKIRAKCNCNVIIQDTPNGKIISFSMDEAITIITNLIGNSDKNVYKDWLEKVRRYCEINRANLLAISSQRFGDLENTRKTLEAMAVLMAGSAYSLNNILLYNACGTLCDVIDAKYSKQKWLDQPACQLVYTILDNPHFFIGKKHEV